jgi:hypothetical protein
MWEETPGKCSCRLEMKHSERQMNFYEPLFSSYRQSTTLTGLGFRVRLASVRVVLKPLVPTLIITVVQKTKRRRRNEIHI